MTTATATRRLAAILAADVAGYSRLIEVDEEGTLERLKAHLRQLLNPKIEEHRGHVVKNTGSHMTPRWREMDSNHQYLEDKRRFVQRLRLCRVFDESLATARFFTPLGIIARNLSGR